MSNEKAMEDFQKKFPEKFQVEFLEKSIRKITGRNFNIIPENISFEHF